MNAKLTAGHVVSLPRSMAWMRGATSILSREVNRTRVTKPLLAILSCIHVLLGELGGFGADRFQLQRVSLPSLRAALTEGGKRVRRIGTGAARSVAACSTGNAMDTYTECET
ncbi:uncharacterized protein LOC105193705 [Solenopsis invicta]|uniref:uncharacterized protein LOC105193705 n=1 Tax=Solenopsis invicta TaxID=13686 RepID=UPI000595FDBB|nr:uncharacterized protein LOC105193705 [Solenopsis invicta]